MAGINWLALSEDPRKQINLVQLLTTQGPTCLWEVWAGRARDIGVLDLGLGLEAGLEPKPEAGYSIASRRGSLAEYASPRLWNQLPASLRQPRTNLSNSASPSSLSGTSSISSIDSPLSSSITPSLFHSRLKNFPFLQILPTTAFLFFLRTDSTDSPDFYCYF